MGDGDVRAYVYGRGDCAACAATRRKLDALGVTYRYLDVSSPAAAGQARRIAERVGSRRLPLVVAGDRMWSGFRKAELESLRPVRTEDGGSPRPVPPGGMGVGM